MSVIIKGMDVPEKCNKCPFVDNDCSVLRTCIICEGDVTADDGDEFDFRPNWCPIEPERKKGKWINAYPKIETDPMFMYGICSECGFEQSLSGKLNFCPNCGSDMREEES